MPYHLLPVYSKLAEPSLMAEHPCLAAALPNNYTLSQHQVETYAALMADDVDVVNNTAMTGDGKSLAAYLPTLVEPERRAFGMYPTNELARDQRRQFASYQQDLGRQLQYDDLWGAKLGQMVEQYPEFKRRAEVLAERLRTNEVILTNPDIFHLMINYRYESGILSSQELPYTLAGFYHDFIFDEFHIFTTPQMVSAVTAMLFLLTTARSGRPDRPRFLFSSATPRGTLDNLLRASGLRVRRISGDYTTMAAAGYRPVLYPADLHLHQLGEQQNVEQWIKDNVAVIQAHWDGAPEPRPRGVIIVNSVVAARRIARLLGQQLRGISVGENTGLTDDERRRQAMGDADLIVGTSTIDVGVDFNISFLLFESSDAGTFLQRLGRLGRCRRSQPPFQQYEAHALFSGRTPWIYTKLVDELAKRNAHDGGKVDRPTVLRDAVMDAFPSSTGFGRYVRRWGALQAAHIIVSLEDRRREGSHATSATKLREQYAQALGLKDMKSAIGRYHYLRRGPNEPMSATCKAILDELLAFRGTSPFQVAVWDDSVNPPAFLSYDALVIAQSSNVCLADPEPFAQALAARYPDPEQRRAALTQFNYVLQHRGKPVALYVEEFWEERERLVLQIDRFDPANTNQILLLRGLSIKQPRTNEIIQLNAILRTQGVVGYLTQREPAELRRRLCLPAMFPLYQVEDSHDKRYTLALGQAALLLEAEALRLRNKDEENAPIFC